MALENEKIAQNARKFFKTGETYGFMNDKFLNFLGESFIAAPASTSTQHNNAFEGGLIDHILRVTKYAVAINGVLPEALQVDKNSLVKVCCLHQIGKAKLFVDNPSTWHKENQGKMYEFNNDLVSMSVGERSIYYALNNGVSLTEEEFQAILNFGKDDSDKQAKHHSTTLSTILKQAIQLAIIEEQANK